MNFKTKITTHYDALLHADQEILSHIGKILVSNIREKMMNQVDVNDQPYAPLSKKYAMKVYSENPSYKTLISHSGKLFASINWEIIGSTLRIYSDKDYAEYHNKGTEHIPQRQFIPDKDSEMITKATKKAINTFIAKQTKKNKK